MLRPLRLLQYLRSVSAKGFPVNTWTTCIERAASQAVSQPMLPGYWEKVPM
jgi:hypothetical protein